MSTTTRLHVWQNTARILRRGRLAYLHPIVPRCHRQDTERSRLQYPANRR